MMEQDLSRQQDRYDQTWRRGLAEGKEQRGNLAASLAFLAATNLIKPTDRILEIGCGIGSVVHELSVAGNNIVGVDISQEAVKYGRSKYGGIRLEVQTAESLSYDDESFDVVLSFDLFEHIAQVDRHISEISRVLRPGGYYLFETPNKYINIIFETLSTRSLRWRQYHPSLHSPRQLRRRLASHGFDARFIKIDPINRFALAKLKKVFGPLGNIVKVLDWTRLPLTLQPNLFVVAREGWARRGRTLQGHEALPDVRHVALRAARQAATMPKKLSILMLNYEFPPIGGGAGKAHLCLLKEYAGNPDLTIDVLTSAPKRGFTAETFADNITIHKVGIRKRNLHFWRKSEVLEWLFRATARYRRLLRDNRYDLVHAFFGFPTGWLCYKTAGQLPYILSLRGSDVPGYNERLGLDYRLLSGLFRRIWTGASTIVANSKGLKELASRFTPDLDIGVIYNGIDTERFAPRGSAGISAPIQALTVCRLIGRKRLDLLIRAVHAAKRHACDVKLNIAGEGNLMDELSGLAGELDLADSVRLLGRVPAEDMPQLYRDNDLFLMSSAHEGMSNAMLEAMASGLPIITTRCEGVEELIGENGIILDRPEPEALAAAVARLAADPDLYESMSIAARRRAEAFTWNAVADEYLACYKKVAGH